MLSPTASAGLEALYYVFDEDDKGANGDGDDNFLAIRARLTAHLDRDDHGSAPIANWSGFYIGGNAGGLFSQNDKIDDVRLASGADGGSGGVAVAQVDSTAGGAGGGGGGGGGAALATFEEDSSFLGGLHVGTNWQRAQWVWGLEGDIDFVEHSYEYIASLRGRIGYAFKDTLIYGTAGVAVAKNDSFNGAVVIGNGEGGGGGAGAGELAVGGTGGEGGAAVVASRDNDDNQTGFVIGAGTDIKLSDTVSLGMESLYYFFDEGNNGSIQNPETGDTIGSLEDDNEFLVVRARLSVHQPSLTEPLK